MSTPASQPPKVSGSSGIQMGNVSVQLQVTPMRNGDVRCDMTCNSKQVRITYRSSGEIDFDNYPFQK